jgi:hypothetical protein
VVVSHRGEALNEGDSANLVSGSICFPENPQLIVMASLIAFDLPPFRAAPLWDNREYRPELCLDVGSTTGAVPPIHPFHNS